MDNKEIVQDLLSKGYLMSLGTLDESGPWVSDVVYVHDNNLNIFWLSKVNTRHSKAIGKNKNVAATITLSNKSGEPNLGLQIEGVATKIDGEDYKLAVKHRQKRNKQLPSKDQKFLEEDASWYRLQPTRIEIINEPLWGFDKHYFELQL